MTYVKKGAMIFLVDDDKVSKYTNEGFEVYVPEPPKPLKPEEEIKSEKEAIAEVKVQKVTDKKAGQKVTEGLKAAADKGETDAENID